MFFVRKNVPDFVVMAGNPLRLSSNRPQTILEREAAFKREAIGSPT
jgi:hypothetical protein